jgi:hypothetical protein
LCKATIINKLAKGKIDAVIKAVTVAAEEGRVMIKGEKCWTC